MNDRTLEQLYKEHTGKVSDKWQLYLVEYDRVLSPYRKGPVRLLEIGVQNGGSLEIWAQYFLGAEAIIGCDIDPGCADLEFADKRIFVVVGNASSAGTQARILECSAEYDVVIDDGSHTSSDIIRSFARYFPHLADGGVYIIEDLHCSYWQEFGGGLYDPESSMSFLKALADVVNFKHWGIRKTRQDIFAGFLSKYGLEQHDYYLRQIHSVEFSNSICVIRKSAAECNELGPRVIAGKTELVAIGHLELPIAQQVDMKSQATNFWSARDLPPADELKIRLKENSIQARQIAKLNQRIEKHNAEVPELRQTIDFQNAQIACLYRSRSWRLTSPLRKIWKFIIFDAEYYLDQNPDVRSNGMDPYEHYINYGQIEGRRPRRPSFVRQFYDDFKAIRDAVRTEGGFFKSAKVCESVYQNEGSSGIKAMVGNILSRPEGNNYTDWIRRYDTLRKDNRTAIREQILRMNKQPLISIVMPTFNTKIEWLREAIDSVRGQLYENWELCIADDASTDDELREFLETVSKDDERIKVTFRLKNGHISKASNSALDLCTGDWVALLDHDDALAEHALYCVAEVINNNPDVQLIYSDEDKIRENGERWEPYFKCDWNRDLFYSQNMISHLGVYRKKIIAEIGGFRAGFEGSQDYDLALRYIEKIDEKAIYHIPRVLYHWRMHAESTARQTDAKPYALIAGEKALQEHLDRTGISAKVERLIFGYRVHYKLPANPPLVSLIVPTRNAMHLLSTCIESILEITTYKNFEIIIVDNGSDDPKIIQYFETLRQMDDIRIIRDDQPFNYSRINNLAVTEARGEIVGFINNDIEVISPEWLDELVSICLQPGVGAVGAKLLYPDDTLQHAGVVLGIGGVGNHAFKHQPAAYNGYFSRATLISSYSALTAACLVISKEVFLQVGGFDAENLAVAFSDVDLCLRVIEAGHRNVWTPYSLLYHHESATRGEDDTKEKQVRFAAEVGYMKSRWGDLLNDDPAYSPNLTLAAEDFSLAWPPRLTAIVSQSTQT